MRKLYNSFVFLFFLAASSFVSYGQIVANSSEVYATCGFLNNEPEFNVLFNDLINGSSFPYTSVILTVVDNPYVGFVTLNTDLSSPNYGFLEFNNPGIMGDFIISYQICEIANPTNCDIGYVTLHSYLEPIFAAPDNFSAFPIDTNLGGTTPSVLENDFSPCFGPLINGASVTSTNLPPNFILNNDGTITVPIGATPGTYIVDYTACEYFSVGNCANSYATIVVTGSSTVIANYDDFSLPHYPNSTTDSVLNNDTINGNPASTSAVQLTPLSVPIGFTLNANGTISIGNVPEGTYTVPYQICDSSNLSSCYVNYAYVVVLKNRIIGKIKFDANNNGCGSDDNYIPNLSVQNINGSATYLSYSNYYGAGSQYYLIGDFGTNTVSVNLPSYFTVTPATQVFNFTTPGTTAAPDFCITANSSVDDLEIVLIPLFNVVPGFPVLYAISYKNNGSTTLNGQVTFVFDVTKMAFLSSAPSPNNVSGNQLTYDFTGLAPFERRVINNVKFQVAIPPIVNMGDYASFSGSITPVASDATPLNNTYAMNQLVVNSQDPNDITVHEGQTITLDQAQDYLHYTIRFQNIGTSNAINIKVVNDLEAKLDWSTFELVSTSHLCRVKNNNGHNEFLFEGINLPGTYNEPLSHGYITYKVKPISTVTIGDEFSNFANIYFDFNAPIVTNTATTLIVPILNNSSFAFSNLNYFPNPVKNTLTISNGTLIESVAISSILGQQILTQKVNDLETEINLSSLSNGIYFVKVVCDGAEKTIKIIKE